MISTKTKKIIAKEIIYLFSIIAFLLVIWIGMMLRSYYLIGKANAYEVQVRALQKQIDSIEIAFKGKEFQTLEQEGIIQLNQLQKSKKDFEQKFVEAENNQFLWTFNVLEYFAICCTLVFLLYPIRLVI